MDRPDFVYHLDIRPNIMGPGMSSKQVKFTRVKPNPQILLIHFNNGNVGSLMQ